MDHLPQPYERFREHASCLCLCAAHDPITNRSRIKKSEEYEFEKSVFLQNRCFEEGISLVDAAPFLQSWLWFELLENVFRIAKVPFDQQDFIQTGKNGELCVSTKYLHRYLWYWVASESQSTIKVQTAHHKIIKGFIQEVFDAVQCFTVTEDPLHVAQIETVSVLGSYILDDDHNTLLQIIILAELLEHAMQVVYDSYKDSFSYATFSWEETLSTRRMLLDAGWCISEVAQLTDQFTDCHTSMLLYLASINRSPLGINHKLCSLQQCVHSKIDYETYVPAHVDGDCTCPPIRIEEQQAWEIHDMLRRGSIPTISFAAGKTSQSKLCLQEWQQASSDFDYVAISHVWSDGLGNLHENALPSCQLAKIQQSVNDLYPDSRVNTPFWMDTLCVPRETTARKLAIKSMRHVYSEAHRVLVLDNSISNLSCVATPQECLIRIKIAPWSTRLWTFHESALAGRISFRLRDDAVLGDKLNDRYFTEPSHGCDVVHLDQLTSNGIHRHLNRALCRALVLRDDGTAFLDVAEDDDSSSIVTTPPREEQYERDLELEEAFSSIENFYTELNDRIVTDQPVSMDDDADVDFGSDSDNMVSRNPALGPILAEIDCIAIDMVEPDCDTARVRVRLDRIRNSLLEISVDTKHMENDVEFVMERVRYTEKWVGKEDALNVARDARRAQIMTEHGTAAEKRNPMPDMTLEKCIQRRCNEHLTVNIPDQWLRTRPSEADRKLRSRLKKIQLGNVRPRFWLAGFDPSITEGFIAYGELRNKSRRFKTEYNDAPTAMDILELISAISFRTTSWLDDEAVCLAIILRLNVARVQACTGTARMKELASMWESVPRGLAFAPVPRLEDDGYRWMPRSFLGAGLSNSLAVLRISNDACRTDEGLHLEAMGILFHVTTEFDQKSAIIFRVNNRVYSISNREAIQNFRWRNLVGQRVAVVFESALDSPDLFWAIIVCYKAEDSELLIVRFEAYVVAVICEADRRDDEWHTLAPDEYHLTSVKQRWCVS